MIGSSWTLGLIAAVVSWNVGFSPPSAGLDTSWISGLYIAAHQGLHFGTRVIFTYGPLGFLWQPWLWYSGLGTIAFIYAAIIHILLCVSLVWALRRTLNPLLAVVAVFLLVVSVGLDGAVALTAVWCLAALSPEAPPFARRFVAIGGAALGAAETLIYLRSGLVILAMCAITLLAGRGWRRDLPIFVGLAVAAFALLWFAAGQSVSNFPSYLANSLQIISGYSDAMGTQSISVAYRVGAAVLGIFIVGAAAYTSPPGRARIAATAIMIVATFALWKEANVRADAGHTLVFFATALVLIASIAFGRRQLIVMVTALAAVLIVTVRLESRVSSPPSFSPITHVRNASDQLNLLFNPARRNLDAYFFAIEMITKQYGLPKTMLTLLKGRTVQVVPWEVAAAWAYGLHWYPGPVLQDYSAYTSRLDALDAKSLRSPIGPQRILRQNPASENPAPVYPNTTLDQRYVAWDPPEKSLAMLCNYLPVQTTASWQVLGKVPGRCEQPQLIGSLTTRYGATIAIPSAPAGEVVYAKIHGAGVSGLERIRAFLFRAAFRYVIVNRAATYRLVPGTAGDGLIMDSGVGVDYPAPFTLAPQARSIKLTGSSGSLRIDLYAMKVRPG